MGSGFAGASRPHYSAPAQVLMALPTSVDLTSKFPPVYDQGPLGSCTGNAIAGVIQFEPKKQNLNSFTPSRLFIDYNERVLGHAVNSDSGAQIGDGMKSSLSWECCPRRTSHTTSLSSPLSRPPVRFAMRPRRCGQEQVTSYQRVTRSLSPFKGCLASGYPFVLDSRYTPALKAPGLPRRDLPPCRRRTNRSRAAMR